MGYKKLSDEQEKMLVEEYMNGVPSKILMAKYGFKTKKSITDKVKKHYGDRYEEIVKANKEKRKGYSYKFNSIKNEFDAYYLGLMLTDGYITSRGTDVGIDLTDEDCIKFLSDSIGKNYQMETGFGENDKTRYRLILSDKELVANLGKYGVVQNKSLILKDVPLAAEEEKFIPYLIRGIIDGDGSVSPTSYGAPQFSIYSASEDFAKWIVYILENKMFMKDIHLAFQKNEHNGIWRVSSANYNNVLKLISLSYDKPFGMNRKYELLRQTFNDYNNSAILNG